MRNLLSSWLYLLRLVVLAGFLLIGLGGAFYLIFVPLDCSPYSDGNITEVEIIPIDLAAPLNLRSSEISGMDWYGEYLIILPQYLDHAEGRVMYAIPKSVLLAYLADPSAVPIEPIRIPVEDQLFGEDFDNGFEGYEAIAILGNQVFLTVETSGGDKMTGYLISGTIQPDLSQVILDTEARQTILLQQQVDNTTNETLLTDGENIISLFEANGAAINPNPVAQVYNPELNPVAELPFPTIEYRVTDATGLDADQNFWVLNVYSLGTISLKPKQDQLAPPGSKICRRPFYHGVERLVELHYDPADGVSLTGRPPVVLAKNGNLFSRNWEGIVRLDEIGFLIATDKYPKTILAFVPLP